jgi:murein DD-endopeptidase MepM/ murein hydrolase activator NlpD
VARFRQHRQWRRFGQFHPQTPAERQATQWSGRRTLQPLRRHADPIHHAQATHNGLDIAAREGTPVVAAMAGTVERAGNAGTYGNLVVLRHPDGSETRYAHLSAINVKKGDQVGAGTPIGAVGTTGRSTGPHLHFELRRDGRPIDPWPLLEDKKLGDAP